MIAAALTLAARVYYAAFPPKPRPEIKAACITIHTGRGSQRVVLKDPLP